jgi:hypothetical protein
MLGYLQSQGVLQNTMQSLPRALSSVGGINAAWICSSCSKARCKSPKTTFFSSSTRTRKISHTSKPRHNAAPTMEQLRQPFQKKNSSTLYYTLSIILGTVAFSYGSVPMYKMVGRRPRPSSKTKTNQSDSRSARRQDGEASPSGLLVMADLRVAIPLSVSNPSLPPRAYE